ncbi:hypothetical protein EHQ23_06755 [Leptospira bourretii]|uniref:Uncharacterized protein n=1 Tax=Leptospira bourretii TaxID=2484962 RepID=A0A4R9IJ85_9LEPT|nr:hypothetical protein EHQ23_06755 [Leptospira bourretii]TGK89237.1 hypothetical protein EHQ26_19280 [Leptospira bourretii]
MKVKKIRSFLGAPTINEYNRGIFITTSEFQKCTVDIANTITK